MTSPIDPIRRSERVRRAKRAPVQRDEAEDAGANLPVPVARATPPAPAPAPAAEPGFAAQLIGQDGQKRGLKGGPAVLEAAKSAYVRTEWSGPADRRAPKGRLTKKEI